MCIYICPYIQYIPVFLFNFCAQYIGESLCKVSLSPTPATHCTHHLPRFQSPSRLPLLWLPQERRLARPLRVSCGGPVECARRDLVAAGGPWAAAGGPWAAAGGSWASRSNCPVCALRITDTSCCIRSSQAVVRSRGPPRCCMLHAAAGGPWASSCGGPSFSSTGAAAGKLCSLASVSAPEPSPAGSGYCVDASRLVCVDTSTCPRAPEPPPAGSAGPLALLVGCSA